MKYEETMELCVQYFKWLTNDENTEMETDEGVVNQGMKKVCEEQYVKFIEE